MRDEKRWLWVSSAMIHVGIEVAGLEVAVADAVAPGARSSAPSRKGLRVLVDQAWHPFSACPARSGLNGSSGAMIMLRP